MKYKMSENLGAVHTHTHTQDSLIKKLKFTSDDILEDNIEYVSRRFPNVIVESEKGKKIDFELLKQELSNEIVESSKEKYELTWPGKREAILTANIPTTKTLRPSKEKSVDFDSTQNIYIEGDNLEALKILQNSYLKKIKCIYIDPPYNTGNDFIYNDNFNRNRNIELEISGQIDENENKLITNPESNGRFHSDWLSMLYPRLKLARNLLSDDGVIFISIDDNEVDNLKKICNEIFGESNFIGNICRATGTTTGQDANKLGSSLDYCLVYSKSSEFKLKGILLNNEDMKRFKDKDEKGRYSLLQLRKTGNADRKEDRPNMFYGIQAPDKSIVYPFGPTNYLSRWRVGKESYYKLEQENMIEWKHIENDEDIIIDGIRKSNWVPYVKYYLEGRTKKISNLFQNIEGNKKGSLQLKELFNEKGIFDNPKPIEFIKILIEISSEKDDIIMDFFSGSATTAHTIMEMNSKDAGKRKFILIQLPEKCGEKSEAYKSGYKTICDIGEERIKRAAKKIRKETNANIDYGFRVYKVDSSNMKDVYYAPDNLKQSQLSMFESNIKVDRSPEDLLTQVILDLGLKLDLKIEEKKILKNKVFFVEDNSLVACFDNEIDINILDKICEAKPLKIVFYEKSFENDNDKINIYERIKKLSPETEINII